MSFPLVPVNGDYFNTFDSNVFKYNSTDNMWLKLPSNNKEIYNISVYSKYLKEETDEYDRNNNNFSDLNLKFLKEVTAPAESGGIITIDLSSEGLTWTIPNTTGTPNSGTLVIYNKTAGKNFYIGKYINDNNITGFEIGSGENVLVDTDEVSLKITNGALIAEEGDTLLIYSNNETDVQFDGGINAFFKITNEVLNETIVDAKDMAENSVFKLETDGANFLLNSSIVASIEDTNFIEFRAYSEIELGEVQNYCYLNINNIEIEESLNSKYTLKIQSDVVLNYIDVLTIGLEEDFTFSKTIGKNKSYGLLIQKDFTSFPIKNLAQAGGNVSAVPETTVLRDEFGRSQIVAPSDDADIANKGYADTKIPLTDLSIDGTFTDNSDTLIPSQKAVKTYVDDKEIYWKDTDSVSHTLTISTEEPSGGSDGAFWVIRET